MRHPVRLVVLAVAGVCALVLTTTGLRDHARSSNRFLQEAARLERWHAHARPGSARAFAIEEKLERIEERREGKPAFDEPDQFARILNEMRIPADRTEPEYTAGYRVRELRAARAAKGAAASPLAWQQRGPGNVAGRARAIVVDPDDATNSTWYIGTAGGGVWKTTDSGATWSALTDDFPVLSVQSLAMAASDHDVMYAGTGESYYNVDTINGNGILKTTDRGASWTHLAATVDDPTFNNVARIVVDPADPDVVLAATTVGRYKESVQPRSSIVRSTDGGNTWVEVMAVTDVGSFGRVKKIQQVIADPTDFDVLYATVDEAGILKSTNAGVTWQYVNTGITDFSGRFELAISPVDHLRLYAAAEGSSHAELWISSDGGATWARTFEAGSEPDWLGGQGWYDNTIVCHPTDPNVVFVGGVQLWQIDLSGTTRTSSQLGQGPVHVDEHGLVVLDDGFGAWRLLNTNDGGVGVSSNGASGWTAPIDGMVTTQFYGVDKRPGRSAYFGGMQDNGTWFSEPDPSALDPWSFAIGGDGYETSWHFDDPLKMIGGYQYNGLQRSLDGGQTWDYAAAGLGDTGGGHAPFITKIAKSQLAPDLLFTVGESGVWRSTNFGGSWSLSAIPYSEWGDISSFHDVKISRANPDIVWAGGRMDDTGMIQVSTNGGITFDPVSNYTAVTMGGISGLATDPVDPNTAYVLFGFAERPKILRTTDLGGTWTDITGYDGSGPSSNGFPDVAVYDLEVFSDDPNHLWAGTEIGLVESLDGGATWALAENGLPDVGVWSMAEVEDEIVIGTHGRGIWSVSMPSLIVGKTFRPLIDGLSQGPDGLLNIAGTLRSAYDSTQVYVNGGVQTTLPGNSEPQQVLVQLPVVSPGMRSVFLSAYRDGVAHNSVARSVDVIVLQEPVYEYANDFASAGDFTGNGFSITTPAGFSNPAIHSQHSYPDNASFTYMLTVPIRVTPQNATMAFDEVVLVEPGEDGSVYGDYNFWDYVVVEGTSDGQHWVPLDGGYDSRADADWLAAWNAHQSGTASLYRPHTIDLHDTFATGDTILLRFRLFSDGSVHGWGWAIDNLDIQPGGAVAVNDVTPSRDVALAQNAPNPFNPSTTIRYDLPRAADVTLRIYDVGGRLVRTLVQASQAAGPHAVEWNGRDDRGAGAASGVYLYRLAADGATQQRSMTLVR